MNYIKQLTEVSRLFYKDKRLKPTHISLYHAIFQMANAHQFPKEIVMQKKDLMQLSKIKSESTYFKCLKQLHQWKYIIYKSSSSPKNLSCICLIDYCNKNSNSLHQNLVKTSSNFGQVDEENSKPNQNLVKTSSNFGQVNEENSEPHQNLAKTSSNFGQVGSLLYINIYNIYINNNNIYNRVKNEILLNIQNFFKENFKKKYADVFSENDLVLEAEKFFNHYEANQWKRGKNNPITDFRPVANAWMINAKSYKLQNKRNFQPKNDLGVVHTKREKNYSEPL